MSGISEHLYSEMMKIMERKPIRDSIQRQEPIVQQWLEDSIQSSGVDATSELVEDLIEMNGIYEGSRPVFNQLVSFAIELDANDIQRGSSKFHGQVSRSGDFGSMDTFFQQGNEIVPIDNPDREPSRILMAEDEVKAEPHPLRASWDSAVERYKEGEASGDTFAMESAERMLDRLRGQIQSAPLAVAPPQPDKAPDTPAQAPEPLDMRARHDALDARLAALPDDGEYRTPEQEQELDAIGAELNSIDDDMDTDPYYADEEYA